MDYQHQQQNDVCTSRISFETIFGFKRELCDAVKRDIVKMDCFFFEPILSEFASGFVFRPKKNMFLTFTEDNAFVTL